MEFTFETVYNQKAMTAMARALRKTIRKKRNRRSHIYGWVVVLLGLLLSVSTLLSNSFTASTAATWIAMLVIIVVMIWEDAINGFIARKRILAGSEKTTTVFTDGGFVSTTELGKTEWKYEKIALIVDLPAYFVFAFSKSHAQVYDKSTLTGGTAAEFAAFLAEKTGKEMQRVK